MYNKLSDGCLLPNCYINAYQMDVCCPIAYQMDVCCPIAYQMDVCCAIAYQMDVCCAIAYINVQLSDGCLLCNSLVRWMFVAQYVQ